MGSTHNNNRILLPFLAVFTLLVTSCSSETSWLPTEFKLKRVLYQTKKEHWFGPGGINHSFTVYKLPQKVSATISDRGLPYLNSLPSVIALKKSSKPPKVSEYEYNTSKGKKKGTTTGPWWGPFVEWHATPVPKEEKWLRYGRDLGKDWKPSIRTFYVSYKGDKSKDEFLLTISPEFSDSFHKAISTPGNFYAYGAYRGMCLVVVSPKMGNVFYLHRD